MIKNSELISKALRIASLCHKGQTRKGKETSFIVHPVEVAMILQEAGMNDYLKTARKEIQIIACADKLSNVKSMARDYEDIGDEFWGRFNAGYKKQKWYYCNLVDSLKNLEGNEVYDEFKAIVKKLFY